MTTQIFSPDALSKIVADTLPAQHDGASTHAIVGALDQHGAQVVAGFKFQNDRWELQAAARHDWNGDNTVGAKVLLQW